MFLLHFKSAREEEASSDIILEWWEARRVSIALSTSMISFVLKVFFSFSQVFTSFFESLDLKAEVKHGASRGSKCQPRGGYKVSKIIVKEPSTIELKRVQMTFQSEVPLKTNRVMVKYFGGLDPGVIASQGRDHM